MNRYKELARLAVAQKCRGSFYYFVQLFWSTIIPEEPVWNWHIEFLCDEAQKVSTNLVQRKPKLYDLLINIPPGSTKSTIITVMFPAWLWIIDPSLKIISNSYSGDLSTEHSSLSKDIITSDKYRALFPEVKLRKDKAGKSSYSNTKKGSRSTTSTGGTITGKHAHLIINDDPLSPKQAHSIPMREEANRHTGTLSSRKTDKRVAVTITIMQRLHEDDVSGTILKKRAQTTADDDGNLRHICLPAEASDNVKPKELLEFYKDGLLDPLRFSRAILQEARSDLGSMDYSGQYDQDPVADGGNIIKSEWFQTISKEDFEILYRRSYPTIHFFVDTAYTESTKNDPTGIIATANLNEKLYILNGKKVRLEFPELVKFLPTWAKENRYSPKSTIRVEPKANGLAVIQQLQRETHLNITNTPNPTDSKLVRTNANTGVMEGGKVVLVDGPWVESFLDEVTGFPLKTHDEYVDLLNYAIDYSLETETAINEQQILNSFR